MRCSRPRSRIKAALDVKRQRCERIGDIPLGFQLAKDKLRKLAMQEGLL